MYYDDPYMVSIFFFYRDLSPKNHVILVVTKKEITLFFTNILYVSRRAVQSCECTCRHPKTVYAGTLTIQSYRRTTIITSHIIIETRINVPV